MFFSFGLVKTNHNMIIRTAKELPTSELPAYYLALVDGAWEPVSVFDTMPFGHGHRRAILIGLEEDQPAENYQYGSRIDLPILP